MHNADYFTMHFDFLNKLFWNVALLVLGICNNIPRAPCVPKYNIIQNKRIIYNVRFTFKMHFYTLRGRDVR